MAARTGPSAEYANAMVALWADVGHTLGRVDELADEPDELASDRGVSALRRLQYRLHLASEQAYGLIPPAGSASAHAELRDALTCARDLTGDVADAVEDDGSDGVLQLLHEWRAALFRVRLARLRLASPAPVGPEAGVTGRHAGVGAPLVAFLLALLGAGAFVAGATLGVWPLWVAGVVAVTATVVVYRP
jgi:hypothetical protein